jgi:hypothetical protein
MERRLLVSSIRALEVTNAERDFLSNRRRM